MITKRAVREFLNRPRDDFRSWKDLSPTALERKKDRLVVTPPIWRVLSEHQKVCLLIAAKTRRFMFFLDTGCGKTLLSIAIARYMRKAKVARRFLVLVPNKGNVSEWMDQRNEWSPQTSITTLVGSSKQKWKTLEDSNSLLTVATFDGLARMICVRVANKKKRGRVKLKPDKKLVARLIARFDGLVMDESTEAQSHLSLPFRLCRKLSQKAQVVIGLTATPFGRDPTPLWPQMKLVDGGESLGETLGLFREAFFSKTKSRWGRGFDYTFQKAKSAQINRLLAHRSIRYDVDQADLPKVLEIRKRVYLSDDADAYAAKARSAIIDARGNYRETKNAFMRMRQISSGFLGYHDDDLGKRAQFIFSENPKLDKLEELVRRLARRDKIVVFHEFQLSGRLIVERLRAMGFADHEFAVLNGKTKDPDKQKSRFKFDERCRVFVVNNESGAYGLNLQVARAIIYYEAPLRIIIRKQTRRRVERQHSKHKTVLVIDLVTVGTFDEKILDNHLEGRALFSAIIEGERSRRTSFRRAA